MPLTPGLTPSLRQQQEEPGAGLGGLEDILVEIEQGHDKPETDDKGNILRIEHDDGSVSVSLDGNPVERAEGENPPGWFDNLVEDIDGSDLGMIADDLLRGIEDDLTSRQDWIEDRAQGIKLLGLKIEIPGLQGASDGAPVEGMSKVRHPLLLEAVLRFQANARSELLPTDGPVKVRSEADGTTIEEDERANALEADLNHYLTAVAKEYYPDTDRMLLMLGFGGTAFKKVYFCPLRGRPVSESVDADDLIVNNAATDLSTAKRITHRVNLKPSTVKRLQILGVYRDVDLGTPSFEEADAVKREKADQQGIAVEARNPDDRDREIYEVYCELDIRGFEHKYKGKITGLEIPYRVTIDKSSREILSIVRNYDEPTGEEGDELPEARVNFVKYQFVPGMGFYDIGLLHILGNTTNAVTAAWREMLDAGMYANFPGFLMADTGARQNTNIFRVPPGGGALVKTGGMPINQAVMPLPYKEPGMALMNLVQNMVETGQRVGTTSELQVGEGRADAPVGTTLALIDQATKILNAVHKRMHVAQAQEFQLLVRCFREHPESFWGKNSKPTRRWDEQQFIEALDDYDIVPQADPNTASQTQRLMKVMGLKQLQASNPGMFDSEKIDIVCMKAMGWSNPEQFIVPQEKRAQIPPEMQKVMEEIKILKQEADAKSLVANASVQEAQVEGQTKMMDAETRRLLAEAKMMEAQAKTGGEGGDEYRSVDAEAKMMDAHTRRQDSDLKALKMGVDIHKLREDSEHREADRMLDAHHRRMDRETDSMHRDADRQSQQALELARTLQQAQGQQETE
jgi:hypothetical protein